MATKEEIAYTDALRALDGQTIDLQNIRAHVNLALTAGGVAAAFLAAQRDDLRWPLIIAVTAFVAIAVLAVLVHLSVNNWSYDFAMDNDIPQLVGDSSISVEEMQLRLALKARCGHTVNKAHLDWRWWVQNVALILFAVEVLALLLNLALA
jgi:hypothetical protein